MRIVRTIAKLAGVACLTGLIDCRHDESAGCPQEFSCVEMGVRQTGETVHTFDTDCVGERCAVMPEGSGVSIGESFHPALRALHIRAGAAAAVRVAVQGDGDGVTIAASVYCADGASLWASDDVSGVTGLLPMSGTAPWHRVDRVASLATTGAREPATSALIRLVVMGVGECAVDRLRFIRSGVVCVRSDFHPVCGLVRDASTDDATIDDRSAYDASTRDAGVHDDLAPDDIPREARDAADATVADDAMDASFGDRP